ncbi:MAG: nitroreductase family protein [Dysgonamonadaceae bacterium]|jgi:predicted oxidoreductase (fatty acid repression mutant protein)|nr:nitroreductase family protein [Dysgonamonadaceae bacterium]
MNNNLKDAIMNRRSIYSLSSKSLISDEEIVEIVNIAIKHVPSAFNCQSARAVVLFGENHAKLWDIVKKTLRKFTPEEQFPATKKKIEESFASGYGTILFFEDQSIIKNLETSFPLYADNFGGWSLQSSGMHQFAVWMMLENAGLGASLQHYNPLIDDEVRKTWKIDPNWKLISEMPFGLPTAEPGEKQFQPLENRVKIFF